MAIQEILNEQRNNGSSPPLPAGIPPEQCKREGCDNDEDNEDEDLSAADIKALAIKEMEREAKERLLAVKKNSLLKEDNNNNKEQERKEKEEREQEQEQEEEEEVTRKKIDSRHYECECDEDMKDDGLSAAAIREMAIKDIEIENSGGERVEEACDEEHSHHRKSIEVENETDFKNMIIQELLMNNKNNNKK